MTTPAPRGVSDATASSAGTSVVPSPPGLSVLLGMNAGACAAPRKDGREALAEVKAHADLRRIPVVVLTTSNADEDLLRSYELSVSGFIRTPASFEGLLAIVGALGKYWIEVVELPPK